MAQFDFDATNIEPNAPFEVLQPGDYTVMIVQSEMRLTKNGQGQYLWLEFDITDGECKGRKLWDRLNLVNPNEKAVEIAKRSLSAICHAVGRLSFKDTEELHHHRLVASVKVRPATEQYEASNEIKGYKPVGAAAAPAGTTPAPSSNGAPAGGAPWAK